MKKLILTVALFSGVILSNAQNIENENIAVKYLRYPTDPLPKEVKTYSTSLYLGTLSSGEDRNSIEKSIERAMELPGYDLIKDSADLSIKISFSSFTVEDRKLVSVANEKKDKDGKVTKWTEYHYDYNYKCPMRISIKNNISGEVLINDYLNSSQDFSQASSGDRKNTESAYVAYTEHLLKSAAAARNSHLSEAENLIKKRYGYTPTLDYVKLKRVKKFKKYEYPTLDEGFDILNASLAALEPVENYVTEDFKANIEKAIGLFQEVLNHADYDDKKARVNEKVASALYNDIALCYYWINDFEKAHETIEKAEGLKGNGWTSVVKSELDAKKSRYEINGLLK